jgi:molybdopterin converting factor small subunit
MKIRTKTNVHMPDIPAEVEMDAGTLRDALLKIFTGTYFAGEIIDPGTGDLKFDTLWDVRVNDVPHYRLSADLDTPLADGDTVSFSLILLGGG